MSGGSDVLLARLALFWLIGGEARAHPARFLATAVTIAIGVALGFAVHLVNGSALASFGEALRSVNGTADLTIRAASPLGFAETLYPAAMKAVGVGDASPIVSLDSTASKTPAAAEDEAPGNGESGAEDAKPGKTDGAASAMPAAASRFTLLGLDVIRAASVTPSLIGLRPNGPDTSRAGVFDGDALFLSRTALTAARAAIGDRLQVRANGRTISLTVAGTLAGVPDGQAIGIMDIAAAQWRFDRLGRLDRLDLKIVDAAQARGSLAGILPADAVLDSGETQATRGSALSRAYRVNLDMLALVALLTGGFLVYSAQSLSVARRLRSFALLRTLGLARGGIVATVALEGLAIGLLGSLAGLLVGYGLAIAALRLLGGDLGAGYFRGGDASVTFQPVAAIVFFALGLAAACLGSVLPALAASKAAPAAALKNSGDMLDPRAAIRVWPALALIGAGLVSSLLPAVGSLPLFGYVGMALLLAGGVAGVPWLARLLLSALARRRIDGVARQLAVRHVHGAPNEAATALCGIVASTALMIAMATMVSSFRGAVDEWLGQILASDLYLRTEAGASFDPALQVKLTAVPGVGRLDFSRQIPLTLDPSRPPVSLIARPIDPKAPEPPLVLIAKRDAAPLDGPPVWVSEPAARLYGWSPGDWIALPIGGFEARFAVAGTWRDYSRQEGAVTIRSADYTRLTGDATRNEAAVILKPGADPQAVEVALQAALPDTLRSSVTMARPAELRRLALELFDRSFAVTYVLEAVAILVGLAGVAATMSAQTIARVREFGMLRHLGVEKRQIITMLGIEGSILGGVGAVAGVALGLVLSQVLIHVVNPQSFNWTMETCIPFATIVSVVVALIAAAAVTAILSARRAAHMNAVMAVREDW